MTNEEIFNIWAPESSVWSPWVKPVLFSYLDQRCYGSLPAYDDDLSWLPTADNTALILDLPGAEGVLLGLEVAEHGYRPVPLYNAIPVPVDSTASSEVDVIPILGAIAGAAPQLAELSFLQGASPAFLLDANRRGSPSPDADKFDNRSICFTTDFPSGKFLRERGITRCILITRKLSEPPSDLAHVLLKWEDAGIEILAKALDNVASPARLHVPRPSAFGMFFQRALSVLKLRRSPTAGFGNWPIDPENHGGGG